MEDVERIDCITMWVPYEDSPTDRHDVLLDPTSVPISDAFDLALLPLYIFGTNRFIVLAADYY